MITAKLRPRWAFDLIPRLYIINFGFRFYWWRFFIQVGYDGPPCRECGRRDTIISWPMDNPGAAIYPDCCPHEEYTYERADRDYFCNECGDRPPLDWHGYDSD